MRKKSTKVGRKPPWQDPDWVVADASAIQNLFRGTANEHQQKRAINFIVSEVCALRYLPRDPANHGNTDFALGKHAVGHFIVMLNSLNLGQITGDRENG